MEPYQLPHSLLELHDLVIRLGTLYHKLKTKERRAVIRWRYRQAAARYNDLKGKNCYPLNVSNFKE